MLKGTAGLMDMGFIPDLANSSAVDWLFFFFFFCLTVIVLLSICSQVIGIPAAFPHREYRLQAHTVAAVRLRRQRAGIQSCL